MDWQYTESFTAGTVGPQGRRIFFIQACCDDQIISLKVEKQQIAGLADFFTGILQDLPSEKRTDQLDSDCLPIDTQKTSFFDPGEADWVIGNLGVTYEQTNDRLILIAEELTIDEDSEPAEARFPLSRSQVKEFIEITHNLIAASRPPCPYCGAPLDPDAAGWCPCAN
tara:strand:+ start:1134 stop:1637 length:504 start_codon:yes stop_codon:yes gene_type:complete